MKARTGLLGLLLLLGAFGCGDGPDAGFRSDLITVEEMRVERVVADVPSLLFIEVDLRNRTPDTVNNFFAARVSAASTSSEFDLTHNQEPFTLVGCVTPDPFDVPPGETKTTRMRVDLSTDPAHYSVACEFDPSIPGFTSSDSRNYEGKRTGPDLPGDFLGPVELELKGTMNSTCRSAADCPDHALVTASAGVAPSE